MHLKISVLGRSHKQQANGNCIVKIMQHKPSLHEGLMLPCTLSQILDWLWFSFWVMYPDHQKNISSYMTKLTYNPASTTLKINLFLVFFLYGVPKCSQLEDKWQNWTYTSLWVIAQVAGFCLAWAPSSHKHPVFSVLRGLNAVLFTGLRFCPFNKWRLQLFKNSGENKKAIEKTWELTAYMSNGLVTEMLLYAFLMHSLS